MIGLNLLILDNFLEGNFETNARIEASKMNMGAGYGVHYLMPYRGADENVSMNLSQRNRDEFSEMMNEKGIGYGEHCGPISTFEPYNSEIN